MRYSKKDQEAQATEIVRECYRKKFSENAKKMAEWLGTSSPSVDRWLSGGVVPGWVVLKILTEYPDLKDFVFAGGEVVPEDPKINELRARIERLLHSKFMFDHLEVQVGICEGYEQQKQADADRAHILQTLAKRGIDEDTIAAINQEILRLYGHGSDANFSIHDSKNPFGPPVSEKGPLSAGGTTAPARQGPAPRRKK